MSAVYVWGANDSGQVGDGSVIDRTWPVPLGQESKGALAVEAGAKYSLVTTHTKDLLSWGSDSSGQLGIGSVAGTGPSLKPVTPLGPSDVAQLSAGDSHAALIRTDQTLWTWGNNGYGQLANAAQLWTGSAAPVQGLPPVVAAAAGAFHTLAADVNGGVWVWGTNISGVLGAPGVAQTSVPISVPGLAKVTAVAAGPLHSLAIGRNGWVFAWGRGDLVGLGAVPLQDTPRRIPQLSRITHLAVGIRHTLARRADGSLWAWGDNKHGQLGDPAIGPGANAPVRIPSLAGVMAIGAGEAHSIAITSDGQMWAWGLNNRGQLGDGTNAPHPVPIPVLGLSQVSAIAAGAAHTLAIAAA